MSCIMTTSLYQQRETECVESFRTCEISTQVLKKFIQSSTADSIVFTITNLTSLYVTHYSKRPSRYQRIKSSMAE